MDEILATCVGVFGHESIQLEAALAQVVVGRALDTRILATTLAVLAAAPHPQAVANVTESADSACTSYSASTGMRTATPPG